MKSTDTAKAVQPREGISGKASAPAFDQIMNLLINLLAKCGLLKRDLDYHVVRASMLKQDVMRASRSADSVQAY